MGLKLCNKIPNEIREVGKRWYVCESEGVGIA
jgi:hypothetical protein